MTTLAYNGTGIDELKEQFEREGYCIARGLLSPEEVEEVKGLFEEMHRQDKKLEDRKDNDPLKLYPRIMQPHRSNERARHYLLHPSVWKVLTALFESSPLAAQSMYYFKPPGARGQALHQDQFYLLVEPGTCIAAWTAIDDCDEENGAMYVAPGTHRCDVICPEEADQEESFTNHLVRVPKGHKAELARMKAGDTLFFNGQVIHGSGPNRSATRWRRAFICHYVSEATERLSGHYQPLLNADGTEMCVEKNARGGPCGELWNGAAH